MTTEALPGPPGGGGPSPAPPRTPPGPPRRALPRLLAKLATDRLGLMSEAAALGDAVRVAIGPRTLYIFNHPEHAKHVLADNTANYHKGIGLSEARRVLGDGLLTSEGRIWREQRTRMQPVFQHKRIAAQASVVAEEAERLVARLRTYRGAGPVDVVEEFTGLTLGVLGRTLLETDLTAHGSVAHAFEVVQDQAMFEMITQGAVPLWAPLPQQMRFRRARRELNRVVDLLVADHRPDGGEGGVGDDALSQMIEAAESRGGPEAGRQRLSDELVTLLLAGHETTASTLSWTFHLLDRHPEVAARARDEARAVLGDRLPEHEDLRELTYITAVVQEAMRLYPPVWILTRRAQEADVIGGYDVPAGADVLICPYTLHRHPGFWPDPERFDPGRFLGDSGGRSRYAYIPFGAGPRFCVGSNLGMMEAVFVTALVVRELRLSTANGHRVVPEPMLSLRMRGGLPMEVGPA
ncbi:cytochrome P450 [Streptomyces amakusaensis]|uniref:Cytochrome P450 n=1 Tax=Streptomyces amakusaensis TaxID=67271 RepID=A0ABW0A929_9ACTN